MPVENINYIDNLRQGTDKLNAAIDQSNEAIDKATTAETNSTNAVNTANNVQTQLNQVVIEGDSSVEAAQARVDSEGNTYTTLKERLDIKEDSFAAQLAEKANEIGILSNDIEKVKNGGLNDNSIPSSKLKISADYDRIKLVNLSDEVLQAMAGTTPVNATPSLNSVTTEKIAPQAVTPDKVSFVKKGKNLFNKATIQYGYFVNWTNGLLEENPDYIYSDWIEVEGNTDYVQTHETHMAIYDVFKNFIVGYQKGTGHKTFKTPSNAKYVRVSFIPTEVNKDIYQLEKGTVSTDYEPFQYIFDTESSTPVSFPAGFIDNIHLKDKSVNSRVVDKDIVKYKKNKNLFNKATIQYGYFVNWTNGLLEANASYWYSDWIEVDPNTDYVQSFETHMAIYDANKTFIVGYQNGTGHKTFKTPSNAKYVRVSHNVANSYETYQLEKGTVSTDYEQYGWVVDNVVEGIPVYFPTNKISSKWEGLIWSSMGDSITAGNTWQPYVTSALGLVNYNFGIGGTKIADTTGTDTNAMCRDERINALNPDSKLITVMGGTNDWAQNVPLGNISDNGTNTFYGAVKVMVEKIITRFPTDRLVLMTPPYGKYPNRSDWTDTYGLKNNLGLTTGDYGKVIMEVARLYGIPCADIYGNAGWNDINIATYINYDGAYLHPNTEGGKRIASVLIGTLRNIEPL